MKRLFLCLLVLVGMTASKVAADDFNIAAKSAMAVDATSGKILYEKDANTPIEVGSITNLLTVYLVYEAIDRGNLTADTYVDISDYAYNLKSKYQQCPFGSQTLQSQGLDCRLLDVQLQQCHDCLG